MSENSRRRENGGTGADCLKSDYMQNEIFTYVHYLRAYKRYQIVNSFWSLK